MITIRGFSKHYDNRLILAIPSLDLNPGVTWVKGENGAGKTTLFKSLAGIIPCEGDITVNNISLTKDPIGYRLRVNYSEAEPLYPTFLTAKDLVRFVGKAKRATIDQQDRYCEALGVNEYFTKACGTYSSGMLKKLSLAMAFLGNPELIILDEPLVTLDERSRNSLLELVKEKTEVKDPITILLSSHQMLDPVILSIDRMLEIKNGGIA